LTGASALRVQAMDAATLGQEHFRDITRSE
jgi:hypothetical protein